MSVDSRWVARRDERGAPAIIVNYSAFVTAELDAPTGASACTRVRAPSLEVALRTPPRSMVKIFSPAQDRCGPGSAKLTASVTMTRLERTDPASIARS